jgi:hypothetical protein
MKFICLLFLLIAGQLNAENLTFDINYSFRHLGHGISEGGFERIGTAFMTQEIVEGKILHSGNEQTLDFLLGLPFTSIITLYAGYNLTLTKRYSNFSFTDTLPGYSTNIFGKFNEDSLSNGFLFRVHFEFK